ncbi:hypothetical protein FQ085_14400 [Planococcus sp. ANT_H30]|uniref:hypothetical protein n=1 Tax=Planococcus sp. ANT_H30 TaxID=2597347 RepID=UPI0011EF93BF|nr:hypothetical protein [Planococcus sp. ANT_H30]KAA0956039.1 hypothetical protein FQ085_14400 [Planococcus sp. ANT_H30]
MTATKKENKRKQKKERSSTYGFLFYSVALFVWSLYDFVLNDKTGWQMPILLIGLAIYLWSKVFYHQQLVKQLAETKNSFKKT